MSDLWSNYENAAAHRRYADTATGATPWYEAQRAVSA